MIERLHRVLDRRLALLPATVRRRPAAQILTRDLTTTGQAARQRSSNGHCRILPTRDGWLALNLARTEDVELIPALTNGIGDNWEAVTRHAAYLTARELRDQAILLQLPVAVAGEAVGTRLTTRHCVPLTARVIDLTALWAGPLCTGLLAEAGAHVLRIYSVTRPDPTPLSSPRLDRAINGAKRRLTIDLSTTAGRALLMAELAKADMLVTSSRPAALARLGLTRECVAAANPALFWVAITAHGFMGAAAERVGFGDDCAIAGGLMRREACGPDFLGDAIADPLTGVEAALAALDRPPGTGGFIDIALAQVAASYALEIGA